MSFHNHEGEEYNRRFGVHQRQEEERKKKLAAEKQESIPSYDDLLNQVKALSAIKKGLETSLTESFSRIKELEKENYRLSTEVAWDKYAISEYKQEVSKLKRQLQSRIKELEEERDELKNSLRNLVQLKDYKDRNGKDNYYEATQPLLWQIARKLLADKQPKNNQ